jgi:hypothetical protein
VVIIGIIKTYEKNVSIWWPLGEEITNFLPGGHQVKKIIKEGKTYSFNGH